MATMRREDDEEQQTVERDEPSSGAGLAIAIVIVGLAVIIGPFVIAGYVKIPTVSQMIISAFGVVLLLAGSLMFSYTQLYVKTGMNEALVRTGQGGTKVVIDGGIMAIPAIHRVARVSLETIRLQISRTGPDSFITGDNLRVDVEAQFYIRVNRDEASIKTAATSLGAKSGMDTLIMKLVGDKLISGLRTVAGRKDLDELHRSVDKYSEEVKTIVEADLEHNGLFLESVTVTHLNQTDLVNLKAETNIFDAQGKRKIAEITNSQRVAIAKLETAADREVKEQQVARDQQIFELELTQKKAKAEADRKALEFQAQQQQQSEIAQVTKQQAVEVAEVDRQQAVQVATAKQMQAVETAKVSQAQAVEIAKRDQQIAVADAERRRADAEAKRITAETEKAKAEQARLTVEQESEATRRKNISVIQKAGEAEQTKITRNMEADVAAYTTIKNAEAEKDAATAQGAAQLTLATAAKQAKELEAAGEQALQIVPVNVAAQQVEVDRKKVEVEKSRLEAQKGNEKMAFDLQIRLAEIEKEKTAAVEFAKAAGQALAAANMTIYGDPTTFRTMMSSLAQGQAYGRLMEGIVAGTPEEVKSLISSGSQAIFTAVSSIAKNMFGKDVTPEVVAAAVNAELAKRANGGVSAQA